MGVGAVSGWIKMGGGLGLSPRVVRGGDRSPAPDADQSAEGRVMRLRGYGNAIVPRVAAAFVSAALDAAAIGGAE